MIRWPVMKQGELVARGALFNVDSLSIMILNCLINVLAELLIIDDVCLIFILSYCKLSEILCNLFALRR
jgi:hypothetical protein